MKMLIYNLNKKLQSRIIYLIGIMLIISAIFVVAEISINPYIPNPEAQKYKFSIDGGLKISGENWFARYSVYFYINGQVYNWEDIPSSIQKDFWKEDISTPSEIKIKYGADFSNISTNIKNNLNYVVLHLEEAENLTMEDIRKEGNSIIIKDKVYISHDDILRTYNILLLNRTDVIVSGLNNNWTECIEWNETMECINEIIVFNWKDNGDGTFNISFDPTITISEQQVITNSILTSITAETGNSNFTHLSIDNLTTPYDNLIGYWNFDGDAVNMLETTSYDFSENHYNGLLYGNATVNNTGCIYEAGNCLKLNGNLTDGEYLSYDYLYITGINYTTTEASLSFWASFQNGSPQTTLFYPSASAFNPIIYVSPATTRTMRIYIQNVSGHTLWDYQSGALFTLNTWNHYVMTYNTTGVYLYQNGALVGSDTTTTSEINFADFLNNKMYIGRHDSTDRYMNCSLDEIMIFNSTLTPTQILNIYNNQISRYATQGTQTINSINISGDGTENRVNITLGDCETNLESSLTGQIGVYSGSAGCSNAPGFYVEPDYYTCNNIADEVACLEQYNCNWDGACQTVLYPECGYFLSEATCEGSSQGNVCNWEYQYNQSVVNFQDCAITNYSFAGNPNDVSLRLTFYAGNSSDPFYSPLAIGNITLESWYEVSSTCIPPTSGNWNWNLADSCTISNMEFNVKNITTSGSGTWEINNANLTVENLDLNTTEAWQIEFINVKVIGD